MRYIRKMQDGERADKVIAYKLPFVWDNTSFGENVNEEELFRAGFVRYEESDLRLGAFKVQEALVYKHISDTLGGFKLVERDMNDDEILYNFGKILSLDEWKREYIEAFNQSANEVYAEYLRKYPDLEQNTFSQKANEAFKVKTNENTPLNETPFLTFLAGENLEARNALAQAVIAKVAYITKFESFCVEKRDAIKACNSIEEIRDIIIDLSDLVIG